jgi:hypothetical protein
MTVTRSVTRSATRSATYGATVGKWGEPSWMRQFETAFDFVNGIYRLNNARVPWTVIDGYHTRTSGRRAEFIDGRSQEYANGVMARTDLGYDSREGWTVLNADPLNPRAWSLNGASASDEPGDFFGFTAASRVASGGATFHRSEVLIAGGVANATTYSIRVLYAAGSSNRCRIVVRNTSGAVESVASGAVGNISSSSTFAGTWASVLNTDRGGGVYELSGLFTATSAGATATLGVGPDSATAGQDVVVIAAQITQTAYPMPFGVGTVAPDSLVIPAADAGLAVDPSVTGLTMVWRGRDFESAAGFPRMLEARLDGNNRASFSRILSSGAVSVDGVSSGTASTLQATLAQAPRGDDTTILQVWRGDGSIWCKIGQNAAGTTTRPPITSISGIGIGNNAGDGADRINAQTRIAAVGAFALSDAEALALFNQVAAS